MRIENRLARRNFFITEAFEAGIVLSGSEVKSLRLGRADLSRSFAKLQNGEVFLNNAFIYPYSQKSSAHFGASKDYDPQRPRKLLMHKSQIRSLLGKLSSKGKALIPLAIYEKNNMFKVWLGLGQHKKKFDKKRALKEKDEARRLERELKV